MSTEPRDRQNPEMPAVRTTIVGGRPPGSGVPLGPVPRGVEILIQKAAVDPDFKALLLEKRSAAAPEIGLTLQPAEAAMLDGVPAQQLEAIIARTKVPENMRRVLLGAMTAAALAALGGSIVIPLLARTQTLGSRPDWGLNSAGSRPKPVYEPEPEVDTRPPVPPEPAQAEGGGEYPTTAPSRGIRPDRPSGSR